jgi:hypothetical protein
LKKKSEFSDENQKNKSPKDKESYRSELLISLLVVVIVALLFIPIITSFFGRGKKKTNISHRRKTS